MNRFQQLSGTITLIWRLGKKKTPEITVFEVLAYRQVNRGVATNQSK